MANGMGGYKHKFRAELFEQQRGLCFYCNAKMSLTNRTKQGYPAKDFATFEHIKRRQDGGKINSENIVLAHRKCNARKNIQDQATGANALGGQNVDTR